MLKRTQLLILFCAVLSFGNFAQAQEADGSADGEILLTIGRSPVQVREEQILNFGTVAFDPDAQGEQLMIVNTDSTVEADDGLLYQENSATAGEFSITGNPDDMVTISLDDERVELEGTNVAVELIPSRTEAVLDGGEARFTVGGQVSLPTDMAPGEYNAAYTVTVNYQ